MAFECWAHAAFRRHSITESSSPSGSFRSTPTSPISSIDSDAASSLDNMESNVDIVDVLRKPLPEGCIPKICVIGAGISGLRCADTLARKGAHVTIFEGRDRIGGRVHQSTHLGHVADLGPNWIHGTGENPILDLAHATDTMYFPPPADQATLLYDDMGHLVDSQISGRWEGLVWDIIKDAYKYSAANGLRIPSEMSLVDFFKMRMQEMKLGEDEATRILQTARVWGDVVGEPIERQSLKYFWLEECIDGPNLFLAGTYKSILEAVARDALSQADLHLNTRVISISSKDIRGSNPSLVVTTTSGQSFCFDEVVTTCPLGWLKRNISAFSPALPPRIMSAITNISYGRLEKVYITFPRAFWLSPASADGLNPFHFQFLCPSYAATTNSHQWSIEGLSLASLPKSVAHPTLLFYVNGPCAQHVTSLVAGLDPLQSDHKQKLTQFFHPYFSRLPNYNVLNPDCDPSAVLATNWIGDDLAGNGSYTTFQTSRTEEGIELDQDIEALRRGCPERGLWFGGEHTAPFVALGTVTGAYWSGELVANRLAKVHGLSRDTVKGNA